MGTLIFSRSAGDSRPLLGRGVSPFGVNLTKLGRGSKGRRPLGGVRGVPEKPLFLFLLAAFGGKRHFATALPHIQGLTKRPRTVSRQEICLWP